MSLYYISWYNHSNYYIHNYISMTSNIISSENSLEIVDVLLTETRLFCSHIGAYVGGTRLQPMPHALPRPTMFA